MSKNLKLGQIVNVFEDGKFFRASKATVVKIESGRVHLDCYSFWVESREVRIFKKVNKLNYYNSATNNFFQPRTLKKSWSVNDEEAPYYEYLLDNTTTLEFDDWYEEKGYDPRSI